MTLTDLKRWIIRRFGGEEVRRRADEKRRWKAADGDHTLRLQYPLGRDSVVLDVGGYRGQWTSDIYAMYRCRIHVFEPIPAFADGISRRFASNRDIIVHRVALGTQDGTAEFADSADSTGRFGRSSDRVRVDVRDATDYLHRHGIGSIDLMKVNIEGDEYALLDHLGRTGMLPNIRFLQIQFHPFVPDADRHLHEAHLLLARTHAPAYQFRYIWEGWTRKR